MEIFFQRFNSFTAVVPELKDHRTRLTRAHGKDCANLATSRKINLLHIRGFFDELVRLGERAKVLLFGNPSTLSPGHQVRWWPSKAHLTSSSRGVNPNRVGDSESLQAALSNEGQESEGHNCNRRSQ